MKHTIQSALVALAIALTTIFTGCTHNYTFTAMQGYPSRLSALYHQSYVIREDHTNGTMCVYGLVNPDPAAEDIFDRLASGDHYILDEGATVDACK